MLQCIAKNFFIVILFLLPYKSTIAQSKKVNQFNQIWAGYINQTRLSNRWGFHAEAHLRTNENFIDNLSQSVLRFGGIYYINDNTKITAGYAHFTTFSASNNTNFSTIEHRLWQQFQWFTKYPKLRLMQWIRVEERYRQKLLNDNELDNSFAFNWRIRYNILLQVPLSKKPFQQKTFSFVTNNELLINFGKEIIYNTFDQNRFFIGFFYQPNKFDNIQMGYMNIFQQLAAGNQYRSLHVAKIIYSHNLDLRKTKKS